MLIIVHCSQVLIINVQNTAHSHIYHNAYYFFLLLFHCSMFVLFTTYFWSELSISNISAIIADDVENRLYVLEGICRAGTSSSIAHLLIVATGQNKQAQY